MTPSTLALRVCSKVTLFAHKKVSTRLILAVAILLRGTVRSRLTLVTSTRKRGSLLTLRMLGGGGCRFPASETRNFCPKPSPDTPEDPGF